MENKSLLVVGNGADLYANLDSTFECFMNDKVGTIENTYNIFSSFKNTASEYLSKNNRQMRNDFKVFKIGLLPFYIKLSNADVDQSIENLKNEMLNDTYIEDLKTKLSLTFSNMKKDYENFEKLYRNIRGYSFWEIFISCLRTSEMSWYDIEKQIENFMTGVLNKRKLDRETSYYLYKSLDNMRDDNYRYEYENGLIYDIKSERLYMFALYYILDKYDEKFNSEEDIDKILLGELYEFEKEFADYLSENIKEHADYSRDLASLYQKLVNISKNKSCNLLTFNYTSINNMPKGISKVKHIHGSIDTNDVKNRSNIIIGIDSNIDYPENCTQEEKDSIYLFTKTSRVLNLVNNHEDVLEDNINEIIFFGHSLGDSDYSYFQSIFDYYDLYSSKLVLKFVFSPRYKDDDSETEKEQRYIEKRESQSKKIANLINNYGQTLENKDHGKNLLHKLLIEERINIINIDG